MTQEEKQLLFKDLCARLPYKVRCKCVNGLGGGKTDKGVLKYIGNCNGVISNYYEDIPIDSGFVNNVFYPIENIKPYLRPMSSMTEEELNECVCQSGIKDIECPNWQDIPKEKQFEARLNHAIAVFLTDSNNVDWLNAHHFDYRGLIEKGLALEAPEGMYNIMEGTFEEYADWMLNIGCATCIYTERLFSLRETKDKSKKFKFEFKCTRKNRIVTADDGQIGWRCRGLSSDKQ